MNQQTKKISTLGMLSALAIIAMLLINIRLMPAAPFLTYDPKDVVIVIGGFMFGPLAALLMSVVIAFIEMITVSETGPFGFLMNTISSATFACTAAIIYKHMRSLKGAVIGLVVGAVLATGVMLLWNYLIVPLYMEVPRHVVVGMLLPIFAPFNLLKFGLNAGFAMLLYKPLKSAISATRMLPETDEEPQKTKLNIGVLVGAAFVILTCVLVVWAMSA